MMPKKILKDIETFETLLVQNDAKEQKNISADGFSRQIAALTHEVLESYEKPKESSQLSTRLSQLEKLLSSALLMEGDNLTDSYADCAHRLLSNILRDTSMTHRFTRETFSVYRTQQELFFKSLYLALLRTFLFQTTKGASFSALQLEKWIKDLRGQPAQPSDKRLFDDYDALFDQDLALRFIWDCCFEAQKLLPRIRGKKYYIQIAEKLFQSSFALGLTDKVSDTWKLPATIAERLLNIGYNVYKFAADYRPLSWYRLVLDIQLNTLQALQQGLPFYITLQEDPASEKLTTDWHVFWAAVVACETVLCSSKSNYAQKRAAMGDGRHTVISGSMPVNLLTLIDYCLKQPNFIKEPACQIALAKTLQRLLDPKTEVPTWVRHLAYYGWEKLKPHLTKEQHPLVKSEKTPWEELEGTSRAVLAPLRSDTAIHPRSSITSIWPESSLWHNETEGLVVISQSHELYNRLTSIVAAWPEAKEQIAFYHDAAKAYHDRANSSEVSNGNTYYAWQALAIQYGYHAWNIAYHNQEVLGVDVGKEQVSLVRILLSGIVHSSMQIFTVTEEVSQLSTAYTNGSKTSLDATQATISAERLNHYLKIMTHLKKLSEHLGKWGFKEDLHKLYGLWAPAQRDYLALYEQHSAWLKSTAQPIPEYHKMHEELRKHYACYGLNSFFYQRPLKEEVSLSSTPTELPWRKLRVTYEETTKSRAWFTEVAEWVSQHLPPSPCDFTPFILSFNDGSYELGIKLVNDFYRHHPYFSHWAEWFNIMVGLASDFHCHVKVGRVSHFNREQPSAILPDAIGSLIELLTVSSKITQDHWYYNVISTHWLSVEPLGMLDWHGRLPSRNHDDLRPHAIALNQQWQQYLFLLTTDEPDKEAPIVQIHWQKLDKPRYLSAKLTERLFESSGEAIGQLKCSTRSATTGRSNVWLLTTEDTDHTLPIAGNTILAYLKAEPHHPWRQWQQIQLAQRIIDYGHTGTVAHLQWGQMKDKVFVSEMKPILVSLSSPAGLTFCTPEESKGEKLAPGIQLLDVEGQKELEKILNALDPYYFTQAVFLTWLLAHEDDQLRNLGFQSFINAQGENVFRIIPFDTDTCLDVLWIRETGGGLTVKLKSLLFCMDNMRQPLSSAACQAFKALHPLAILESWLKTIATADDPANQLSERSFNALYRRWDRLHHVLSLPASSNSMDLTFPQNHFQLLTLLDAPLGQVYSQAAAEKSNLLERFDQVSHDYMRLTGMRISVSTGLLRRNESITPEQKMVSISEEKRTLHIKKILQRCIYYRQEKDELYESYYQYLLRQIQSINPAQINKFNTQMDFLVGDMKLLNSETIKKYQERSQQKNRLAHIKTQKSQWESLVQPGLNIIIIPEIDTAIALDNWKTNCTSTAKPSIRLTRDASDAWEVSIHDGRYLLVSKQCLSHRISLPIDLPWNLYPLIRVTLWSVPTVESVRDAIQTIYKGISDIIDKYEKLLDQNAAAIQLLAKKRQDYIKNRQHTESLGNFKESDPQFLLPLLDSALRQSILNRFQWKTLRVGKGLKILLRLLELGDLTELYISGCTELTDTLLIELVQNSPQLMAINISGCLQLTKAAIYFLAEGALHLTHLSARELPQLTEIWRGILWSLNQAVHFPQLSHADFSACNNLQYLAIDAPQLRYLHLRQSGSSVAHNLFNKEVDWYLITPKLHTLSLSGAYVTHFKTNSRMLENLDLGQIKLPLNNLQALITAIQWARLSTLSLTDSDFLEWNKLSTYPFLIPLVERWLTIEQWKKLTTYLTQQTIIPDLSCLGYSGRRHLQRGVFLLHWEKREMVSETLFKKLCAAMKSEKKNIQLAAAEALKQLKIFYPNATVENIPELSELIKSSSDDLSPIAKKTIIQPVREFVPPNLEYPKNLLPIFQLLNNPYFDIHEKAAKKLGRIAVIDPAYAGLILPALFSSVRCHKNVVAIQALGQFILYHSKYTDQVLPQLLMIMKEKDNLWNKPIHKEIAKVLAQLKIAEFHTANQVFLTLKEVIDNTKDKYDRYEVRQLIIHIMVNLAVSTPKLCNRIFEILLEILKEENGYRGEEIRESILKEIDELIIESSVLAKAALPILFLAIKDRYDWIRKLSANVLERITITYPKYAMHVLPVLLIVIKNEKYENVIKAITRVLGNTDSEDAQFSEEIISVLFDLMKSEDRYEVRIAAARAISKNMIVTPWISCLDIFTRIWSQLSSKKEDIIYSLALTIDVLTQVNTHYYLRSLEESATDYLHHFLGQWIVAHPVAKATLSHPPKSTIEDSDLVKKGHNRHYWYSIADMYSLILILRKKHLNYYLLDGSKQKYSHLEGEEFSAYRENQQGIFIANPYVAAGDSSFVQCLEEDIATLSQGPQRWKKMPRYLCFTYCKHAHWLNITLEIEYKSKVGYSIFWNDPLGKELFSESYYAEISHDLLFAVQGLIKTENTKLPEGKLPCARYIKNIDQQGQSMNGYDCGPISISNLTDIVKHIKKGANLTSFDEESFTVPVTGSINWTSIVNKIRETHRELSTDSIAASSIKLASCIGRFYKQKADILQDQVTRKKTIPTTLTEKIGSLSEEHLGILFSMIDHQRILSKGKMMEPYSIAELETCFAELQRYLSTDISKQKLPVPLGFLFKPVDTQEHASSSSAVELSTSSQETQRREARSGSLTRSPGATNLLR